MIRFFRRDAEGGVPYKSIRRPFFANRFFHSPFCDAADYAKSKEIKSKLPPLPSTLK
jgi:hypothetical protein